MTAALAVAAAVSAGASVTCLVVLHVSPTGYSPVRNAVSEYGVGRFAGWYRAQAAYAGLAAVLLAGALARGLDPVSRRVVALLVVFALARVAIGFFPTDLIGATERTRTGAIHGLLAVAAFVSISWAASALPAHEHGARWLGYVMTAAVVGMVVSVRTPALRVYFGLIERGFYAAFLAWIFLVSLRLAGV
jgi:Protein of unknown function (DUF998)